VPAGGSARLQTGATALPLGVLLSRVLVLLARSAFSTALMHCGARWRRLGVSPTQRLWRLECRPTPDEAAAPIPGLLRARSDRFTPAWRRLHWAHVGEVAVPYTELHGRAVTGSRGTGPDTDADTFHIRSADPVHAVSTWEACGYADSRRLRVISRGGVLEHVFTRAMAHERAPTRRTSTTLTRSSAGERGGSRGATVTRSATRLTGSRTNPRRIRARVRVSLPRRGPAVLDHGRTVGVTVR
jgi:hypothetical protein